MNVKVEASIMDVLPGTQPQKKSAGDSAAVDFLAHLDNAASNRPAKSETAKPQANGKNQKAEEPDVEDADKNEETAHGDEAVVIAQVPIMTEPEQVVADEAQLLSVETVEPVAETAGATVPVEADLPEGVVADTEQPSVDMIPEETPVIVSDPELSEGELIERFAGALVSAEDETQATDAGAKEAVNTKPADEKTVVDVKIPMAEVETDEPETGAVLTKQPEEAGTSADQQQTTQKAQDAQSAVASVLSQAEELEPEAAQFLRQTLSELNAASRDSGNVITQATTADEADAVQNVQQQDGDEQQAGDDMAKQQKEPVRQPLTAAIAHDGRVQFNLEAPQEVQPQQAAGQSQAARDVQFQIIEQVRTMVAENRSEFVLQLKPGHLGGLTIMLASEKDGIVAKMMTANKDVHMMMQSEMAKMQESLRERGINVVQMEVVYDQMAGGATGKQDTNSGQGWEQGSGSFITGTKGLAQDGVDAEGMAITYEEMSSYDVLAEQGGSVEFTA